MRVTTADVEIPLEMSKFDELKTLVEHVGHNERVTAKCPLQGSRVEKDGPMEGGRSLTEPEEHHRESAQQNTALEKKEQTKKISKVHLKHACGTWRRRRTALCSYQEAAQSRQNGLAQDRAYNNLVTIHPGTKRGCPHIWFFTAMLRGVEKALAIKNSAMTTKDQGEAEAVETLRTTVDNQHTQDMLALIKACRHLPIIKKKNLGKE